MRLFYKIENYLQNLLIKFLYASLYNNNNNNTITKVKICHSSNYFCLTNICFCLNKWQYRVLIQLLRVFSLQNYEFIHPKRLKDKQNLVNAHSLASKILNGLLKKINSNL